MGVSTRGGRRAPALALVALLGACGDGAARSGEHAEAGAKHATLTFGDTPTLPLGASAVAIATGDFNGDGHLDIAAACGCAGVFVLLGRGGGAFEPARRLEACAEGIVAADLNGDGALDLAVPGASVLLGNGDGTFQAPRRVSWGSSMIAAGHFDGDGIVDLALGHETGKVSLLLGKGDGTYQPERFHDAVKHLNTLIAADFDGDGRPDLFAGGKTQRTVLLAERDGTLQRTHVADTSDGGLGKYLAFAVADLDGDGRADLAQGHKSGDARELEVLLGDGDGSYRGGWNEYLGIYRAPTAIAAGDFDADGIPDLAIGFARTVLVIRGNGDGTFDGEDYFGLPGTPQALAAADLDGDGLVDLVSASSESTGLAVLFGRGDGTFRGEGAFGVGSRPIRIVAGDFDGDGAPDALVTTAENIDAYTVLLGDGRGGMRALPGGPIEDAHGEIATADLDGDGKLDLVSADRATVLRGQGDGTFAAPVRASSYFAEEIVVGDFDGDGKVDLVPLPHLLINKGDGTFAPPSQLTPHLDHPTRAAVADLDDDDKLDLVIAGAAGLSLRFGGGDGSFEATQALMGAEPPYGVAAADLDGDGSVDLVGYRLTREGTLLHVFRNAGQRTFVPTDALQIEGSAMGLVVRDLNGDGIPDLATGTSFLIGNGNGTFQAPRSFSLEANAFALIDLDLDGLPDVVLTHIQSPFLRVEMNTSR